MQQTPRFVRDIKRLTGKTYDPHNLAEAMWAACIFMDHYAPLAGLTPRDGDKLAAMYRFGFAGYMDRQGER